MIHYSIHQLEKLSGIKAHTIRIWEQRYKILEPYRTNTNIRYYDNGHLKKLLNIKSLLNNGYKISAVSQLSNEQIISYLDGITNQNDASKEDIFIHQLIESGLNFSESRFEKVFSNAILRIGLEETYIKIIYPLLEKIGLMWCQEQLNPAQEHFISQLIKQKLYSAIDALPAAENSKHSYILFLGEEEGHDIGLLMANYMLRLKGVKVIYLGPYVPLEHLKMTVEHCKPTHLMTFLKEYEVKGYKERYINELCACFPQQSLVFAGHVPAEYQLRMPANCAFASSINQFKDLLN